MRLPSIVCLLLAAAALAACGSTGGETTADTAPATSGGEGSAGPACRPAPKLLAKALRSSLTTRGGARLEQLNVVRVTDVESPLAGFDAGIYAVAGRFAGGRADGTAILWAVSREMVRTGGGLAMGATDATRRYSELGVAAQPGSPVRDFTDEVAESEAARQAIACAKGS